MAGYQTWSRYNGHQHFNKVWIRSDENCLTSTADNIYDRQTDGQGQINMSQTSLCGSRNNEPLTMVL